MAIADIYYRRIKLGEITLEDVPSLWYEQVKEKLEKEG